MELRCDSDRLASALGQVARAISSRTSLPALGTVLLEARDDRLLLTATNLELWIRRQVDAEIADVGAIAVPGRVLADFAHALPAAPLLMRSTYGVDRLFLACETFQTELHGIPSDEFPPPPATGGGASFEVAAPGLVTAITDTLAATSSDEARPLFTGIHLSLENGQLLLVATDGYRLAVRRVCPERCGGTGPIRVTIPARAMAEAARLFRGIDRPVTFTVSPAGSQVWVRGPGTEIASRVIDGAFPDHRRLIPRQATTVARVGACDLAHRLRAIAPFAQGSSRAVRLDAGAGAIRMVAAAAEIGTATADLQAQIEGSETSVAFNARYLLDCPALAAEEELSLHLHGPLGPIIVRRSGSDDYLYLFMPIVHAAWPAQRERSWRSQSPI